MTTVIYASLSAFLIVWLSLHVIKIRHSERIALGNGDNHKLILAQAAQANALEYIPIALILLFALEYNGAYLILVHLLGLALLTGRAIHAKAILTENLKTRVLGMQITIWTIIALAISNLIFLPYDKLL